MDFDLCFSPFRPSLNTPCKAVSRHTAKAMIETTKATLTICLYLLWLILYQRGLGFVWEKSKESLRMKKELPKQPFRNWQWETRF